MLRCPLIAASILLAVSCSDWTQACTICLGLPEKSDADHLLDGHCVVLAREDPNVPYSYAPVEVLKGKFDGREINLLVDSLTRKRLALEDDLKVVLIQGQEGGDWQSLGIAGPAYEMVVRRILLLASSWNTDAARTERVEFFLPLFGHGDPRVHRLAYLEIGRAPYGVIRRFGKIAPREHVLSMLNNRRYYNWRPLAILLLAQSGRADDAARIRESLASAERFSLATNLAAWITAAIELDGDEAIAFVEERYCRRPERTAEEMLEVVRALSLHGHARSGRLRERIIAAYGVLLEHRPALSGQVVGDLAAWRATDDLASRHEAVETGSPLGDNAPSDKATLKAPVANAAD